MKVNGKLILICILIAEASAENYRNFLGKESHYLLEMYDLNVIQVPMHEPEQYQTAYMDEKNDIIIYPKNGIIHRIEYYDLEILNSQFSKGDEFCSVLKGIDNPTLEYEISSELNIRDNTKGYSYHFTVTDVPLYKMATKEGISIDDERLCEANLVYISID